MVAPVVVQTDGPGLAVTTLTRADVESFRDHGLVVDSIAEVYDDGPHQVRRWCAWFTRPNP